MVSAERLKQICIPLSDQAAYKKRKLRVATIGAGFSGLIFAHKVQHEQPDLQEFIDLVIYEANDDVGGTWKVNTYPGVQCDVPAHIYVGLRYSCLLRLRCIISGSVLTGSFPGISIRSEPKLVQILC